MTNLTISTTHSLVPEPEFAAAAERLEPALERLRNAAKNGYEDAASSINLPGDHGMIDWVNEHAALFHDVSTLIVIGIGGSNLGTVAVHEAVLGKHSNLLDRKKILFADTVDADKTHDLIRIMHEELSAGKRVVLNVISKSGGTTEPVALYNTLLPVLKEHRDDWENHVVITSGEGSKLWKYAEEHGLLKFSIPERVGGRYSVFSPVGLFPLAVAGIDINELCAGAAEMRNACLHAFEENPAARSAAFIHHHATRGKNIHDTFVWSTELESVGKWYRQLMGESVGKEHDLDGNTINAGITPTISIGSTDLHSQAQLFLGGPHDKSWTFINVGHVADVKIPDDREIDRLVRYLRGTDLQHVMEAMRSGTATAFVNNDRPFVEIHIPNRSAHSIGGLLQMKMMEMILLAHLMHVNPFDQPNVEAYKVETRKNLASGAGTTGPKLTKIYLGADHAGYAYKERIKDHLTQRGIPYEDLGTQEPEEHDDYPQFAEAVGRRVAAEHARGILVCGSGTGMVIAANKIPGVRAQVAFDAYGAVMGRRDNDTNILALRGREFSEDQVIPIVDAWLDEPFSHEPRHERRIEEIRRMECNE